MSAVCSAVQVKRVSGRTMKHVHAALTIFWVALWATAAIFGWLSSVVFVSHLSVVALILASLSSWQGARTESKQDDNSAD